MKKQKKLNCGIGPLFMDPDPDKARAFFKNKSRALTDKIMSVKEAVTYYGKRWAISKAIAITENPGEFQVRY